MKANIISYLQTYGQESFQQRAFNGVDALILCQFSYLKFDGIIPGIPENRAGKGFLNKSAEKTGTFQRAGGCEEDASEDPGNPEDPESSEDPENPEDLGNFGEKKTCPW